MIFLQIESGKATLNERDTTGATPAHYAAAQGNNLKIMGTAVIFYPMDKCLFALT